ncbi:MAG: helix-turn-helix transcriptional regulator [Frankiales bacterium]|nr:helix-turn-helix transcriptional regulator [Frankiales bacterium]
MLAERGIAELSMRALAGRLGVAPNALYSHIASKTQLLDDLLATVQAPAPDAANAVDGLCALMGSTYAVLTAQADLVPLYLSRHAEPGTRQS